jgi:hypothetical protein
MGSVVFFEKTHGEPPPTWDFTNPEQALVPSETSNIDGRAAIHSVHVRLENAENAYGQVLEGCYLEISGPWIRMAIEFDNTATTEYVSYETDRTLYSAWARSVLPTVAISEGRSFTLAFSDDKQEPTCYYSAYGDYGYLHFPRIASRPSAHNPTLVTGDAMRFSLDEEFQPLSFETRQTFYTFDLQHVTGNYFLMLRDYEGKRGSYQRIGLAECIQLPGNKFGLLEHLLKTRGIKIV